MTCRAVFVFWIAVALASGAQAADLIITEVMSSNRLAVNDEDGDTPDWAEIYNAGDTTVRLAGWHLTDNARRLEKWSFPDIRLEPRRFLRVFLSGKNRRDPDSELHTNFKLAEDEFLLLVDDSGDVASLIRVDADAVDLSFGVPMESQATGLVSVGDEARFLVPADDSLGLSWTETDFDDGGWSSGAQGIGFGSDFSDHVQTDVVAAMRGVNASIYVRLGFFVDDPDSLSALRLKLRYNDGLVAYVNGEEVLRRNAPEELAWDARAPRKLSVTDPETVDLSAGIGQLNAGQNVLAIHGLNLNQLSSDFLLAVELIAETVDSLDAENLVFFETPTPGTANSPSGFQRLAQTPNFSRPSGPYAGPFSLELSVASANASIRYTTDDTLPSEASPLYTGPIFIDRGVAVRARTFEEGSLPSALAIETYAILEGEVADFSSHLPIMVVDTFGEDVPPTQVKRFTGNAFSVFEPAGSGTVSLSSTPSLSGYGGIRIRGSSSATFFPKKMYGFEIWDVFGEDDDAEMMGLPEESDWVLNGPYSDKTLMRNALSYGFSNDAGRYAPRTRFFELFVNTSGNVDAADYLGVYVLMEKIKPGASRVAISKLYPSQEDEPEVTGGYLFKIDRVDAGEATIKTGRGVLLVMVKPDLPTETQLGYLEDYMNEFEGVLFGADYADPESGYAAFIDVDSFIDHQILVETMKNIDGYRLSTFMHKDRGGKLVMGPLWDYNLSLGNSEGLNGFRPEGWYMDEPIDPLTAVLWYRRLMEDTAYRERLFTRWRNLRDTVFSTTRMLGVVDGNVQTIGDAQISNFETWPSLGVDIWPNYFVGQTYQEEVDWMKGWLSDRLDWMDGALRFPAPRFELPGGTVGVDFRVGINSGVGEIFYTLDGSDPQLESGDPGPAAILYEGPFQLSESATVKTRALAAGRWSEAAEVTYFLVTTALAPTEILFDPVAPDGSAFSGTQFEFFEVANVGQEALDLEGFKFTAGITFEFGAGTVLEAGEHTIVVKNLEAFRELGLTGLRIAGQFAGALGNFGELIRLEDPDGAPVMEFRYESEWYPETHGGGKSLVLVDSQVPPEGWGQRDNWMPSQIVGGSPGRGESQPGFQRRGDITQDARLNIADALGLFQFVFGGAPVTLPCGDGGVEANVALLDLDGDRNIQISDPTYLLNYLFLRGDPPAGGTRCEARLGCPDACAP